MFYHEAYAPPSDGNITSDTPPPPLKLNDNISADCAFHSPLLGVGLFWFKSWNLHLLGKHRRCCQLPLPTTTLVAATRERNNITTMGIQSQSALLFKSKEIELVDIIYLLEQRHAERRRLSLTTLVRPKVTIDASLIVYKYLGTSLHPSDSVFMISTVFANQNVDVRIICDPPTRHHSKQAHHQRVWGRKKQQNWISCCVAWNCRVLVVIWRRYKN